MSRLSDFWQLLSTKHRILTFAILLMAILRMPSLFEGFWYGDEGIYAALAQGMHDGKQLYTEVWDHKPPLIYWLYFLGGFSSSWFLSIALIKALSIICSAVSLWLISRISRHFSISRIGHTAAVLIAALLLGLPILEANTANAEVFFLPLNLAVIYLLLQQRWYVVIGVLAGLGVMLKFHSGFESALVTVIILLLQKLSEALSWQQVGIRLAKIIMGGVIVVLPYALYVVFQGIAQPVLDAILLYNFYYTSYANDGISILGIHLNNSFAYLCALSLGVGLLIAAVRKQLIDARVAIGISILAIEYMAAILPGRAYGHYLIQAIPGVVLGIGLLVDALLQRGIKRKVVIGFGALFVASLLLAGFLKGGSLFGPSLIADYYTQFVQEKVSNSGSQSFPYNQQINSIQAEELANYIDQTHPGKSYYFYGNMPWVLALTENTFTNTFVVWYHRPYDHPVSVEDRQHADMIVVDTGVWQADLLLDQLASEYDHREVYQQFAILW